MAGALSGSPRHRRAGRGSAVGRRRRRPARHRDRPHHPAPHHQLRHRRHRNRTASTGARISNSSRLSAGTPASGKLHPCRRSDVRLRGVRHRDRGRSATHLAGHRGCRSRAAAVLGGVGAVVTVSFWRRWSGRWRGCTDTRPRAPRPAIWSAPPRCPRGGDGRSGPVDGLRAARRRRGHDRRRARAVATPRPLAAVPAGGGRHGRWPSW